MKSVSLVSISSPSSEGGGSFYVGHMKKLGMLVSISSPSSEGGGPPRGGEMDKERKFPLVLLQAKVVGVL